MEIALCGLKRNEANAVFGLVYNETKRIEKMLNRFDPQSEVSQLNKTKSGKISEELRAIIEQCSKFKALTSGCFDVCINPEKNTLNFDFGAYAKGYVLDKIKTIFTEASVSNALINFGNSSILASGHHPLGDCWKISLQHSFNPHLSVYTFDLLDDILTTSGILPTKMAHIKSPFTGEFCTEKSTYSVVTKLATEGEAITTALYVAGNLDQQKRILQNFGLKKALKVDYEGENFKVDEIII
jgi:thiamine biosynthesis lipoprotein